MIKLTGLALSLTMTASPVMAQTPPPPPPAEAKVQAAAYVEAAGMSDLYEINSSQIALDKSRDPAVRKFAQMMIDHHQKTTAATVKAAQSAGLAPKAPALDTGATASIRELQNAPAADFDRLYLGQQLPAHQAALDLHQAFSASGDKPSLKASARSAVPIVKQHLSMLEKMQSGKAAGHAM